jgi:hypothetical protein
MKHLTRSVGILSLLLVMPAEVYAQASQASITGVARDTSGAVLPGVTVETSSPALIEKVRTVVTDGSGQYRFVDLRPGTYTVSFMLPGFAVHRREGIVLSGSLTATINAELRVGALEETVTVTGETPIVDVQSAGLQQTLDKDVIAAIPTSRLYHAIVALTPGVVTSGTQDVGGIDGPSFKLFAIHGGRTNEGLVNVDGLNVGAGLNGSGVSYYVADIGNSQEVSMNLSGGLGESDRGGPVINVVPRQGGNNFSGTFFATGANGSMQGDNFDQALKDAGLTTPAALRKIWDVNGSIGGPIVRDKLWFYWTARHQGNRKFVTGMFLDANAGDLTKWTYAPSATRATDGGTWKSTSGRLAWQATARNKVNVFWDEQAMCSTGCVRGSMTGGTPTRSPEAHQPTESYPTHVQQLTWTSPVTNRLLLEAGAGTNLLQWGGKERPDNNRDLIPVTEQMGLIPNLVYRGQQAWSRNWIGVHSWRTSLSYVTGAHSTKVGYMGQYLVSDVNNFRPNSRLEYRFQNNVPNRLTMQGDHGAKTSNRTGVTSLYAQDQWTRGQLTLQGGLRYDRAWSWAPEQQVGPDRFIPIGFVLPRTKGVDAFNDITIRAAGAYDLFGNGKTAVKVNVGEYLEAAQNSVRYLATNPRNRVDTNTNRTWGDANSNFVPDCDLLNPAKNGECGAWEDQGFGKDLFTTTFDPALISGWNVRPNDWQFGVGVQHEILPRISADVSYNRRWFGNFQVTDDRSVGPTDYQAYSIVAPTDSRLPGGGGQTIGDLYDLTPTAAFGRVRDNFVTLSGNFGNQIQYWHGVDFNVRARTQNGAIVQGGFNTGRTVEDRCDVTPKIDNPSTRFCRVVQDWRTQVKLLGSYVIPKIDVMTSATFQSVPGTFLRANLVVSSAQTTLGRALTTGTATINLIQPESVFGDRVNQVDFRVAKILRFGGRRTQIALDLFNALNSNDVESRIETFGNRYLVPTGVLTARFVKISGQIDF